jgi:spore coat polysaccharide biosynthesis protein SpsF
VSDVAIVLQARMRSTRLPGKVLYRLGRHTLLGHCIRRLQTSGAGPIIVATTAADEDAAVVAEARRMGCEAVRGATNDVLARYVAAANHAGARVIVRATADNPAVDIGTTARLLDAMAACGAEYGMEQGLPYGSATEVIAADTLRGLLGVTARRADREHVTLYIKQHLDAFRTVTPDAPPEVRRPGLRLTVDTPDDLVFMRRVLDGLDDGAGPAPLPDIIAEAERLLARRAA